MTTQLENCANCGRTIGKLETPRLFKNQVVCSACDEVLRHERRAPAEDVSAGIDSELGQRSDVASRDFELEEAAKLGRRPTPSYATPRPQHGGMSAARALRLIGVLMAIGGMLGGFGLLYLVDKGMTDFRPIAAVSFVVCVIGLLVFAAGRILGDRDG